ncbi:hypothetical protein D3C81_890100 [compost metagenome]
MVTKTLLLLNGKYLTFNNTTNMWEIISTSNATENDFVEKGITDLTTLTTSKSTISLSMEHIGITGNGHVYELKLPTNYGPISAITQK